jgi:hypothetical protein
MIFLEAKAMYQVPAQIWQAVAEMEMLRTDWAREVFPLPQDLLDEAIETMVVNLRAKANETLPAPYLTVMPLLWEQEAIRTYLETAGPMAAFPPIETVDDAMAVAIGDFLMTQDEKATLRAMLLAPPSLELLRSA